MLSYSRCSWKWYLLLKPRRIHSPDVGQRGQAMHFLTNSFKFLAHWYRQYGRRWPSHAWTQRKQNIPKRKTCATEGKIKNKALASHDILQFLNFQITFLPPSAKRKAINIKITIWLPKTGPINQFSKPQLTSQGTPCSFPRSFLTDSSVLPVCAAAPGCTHCVRRVALVDGALEVCPKLIKGNYLKKKNFQVLSWMLLQALIFLKGLIRCTACLPRFPGEK